MLEIIRLVLKLGQNYAEVHTRYRFSTSRIEYRFGRTVISILEHNTPTSIQLWTCSMIHFVRLNLNLNTLIYIKTRFYRIAINNVGHTQIAYQYFPLNSFSFKEHGSIKIKTTTKMICIPLLNELSNMDRYFFSHLPNFFTPIFLKIIKHVIYIGCLLKAKEAG